MIVGSLLLILVAVTLLVFGLANGSSTLLISSIAASLLAAVALVVGARQAAGRTVVADDTMVDHGPVSPSGTHSGSPLRSGRPRADEQFDPSTPDGPVYDADPYETSLLENDRPERAAKAGDPLAAATGTPDGAEPPAPDDPADEPAQQRVGPADAAHLARTTIEVLVVDGRPRYHLAGCPHLTGRDTEPVPVAEAIDLGFTPCGRCRPVDRLVVAARRA